ncbi:hypothetical protein OGATHE_000195 [Ogataea polymorpha]|uniref:Uncharacterized protein n=1 Tax=Ogataea polymorpha TaxID=460523 RepID=A0A9P8PW32_9ASCO|nr:hypothetical protein OGATHE_000195 [Ogataea polymorpha]
MKSRALRTSSPNLAVLSLLTIATKHSHSPRTLAGSLYVSMKPMLVSTAGPISLTQCTCDCRVVAKSKLQGSLFAVYVELDCVGIVARRVGDVGRRDVHAKQRVVHLLESRVFRHDSVCGKRRVDSLDLGLRQSVQVVAGHVTFSGPTQQHPFRVQGVHVVLDLLKQLQTHLVVDELDQRLEVALRQPRDELHVAKRLVVAQVAQKLGGVLQVPFDDVLAQMLFQMGVVCLDSSVGGQDQVVDPLRLGRNRAQDDSCSPMARLGHVVGIQLLVTAQLLEVGLGREPGNWGTGVGVVRGRTQG